jgi:hypothetical protein
VRRIDEEKEMNTMTRSINCGNCGEKHESVEAVKACYGLSIEPSDRPLSRPTETEPVWSDRTPRGSRTPVPTEFTKRSEPGITVKQENFLNKLLDERPALRDVENLWPDVVAKLSKRDASAKISEVMNTPKEKHADSGKDSAGALNNILAEIEDCYMALPSRTGHNDLDFIRIGTNQGQMDPRRKGWRRVQRIVGGQAPISMRVGEAMEFAKIVVAMTEDERKAAQVLFGQEIGRCGKCGKTLTDEESRAAGIGPVCRAGF